jgi:hypothetical protein
MAFQYSVTLRTNQVGQIQTTISTSGTLKIFSGAEPANCAAADPSGLLATITLPASFLTSASGATTIAGSWTVAASGTGTAASFRMYDGSATCHVQGNVTATGGGGDLTLDNTSISSGQTVTVTTCTITAGNS